MSPVNALPGLSSPNTPEARSLEERLERCEIVYYPVCPFPLPEGDDRQFLYRQRVGRGHKNISYDPHSARLLGARTSSAADEARLHELLANFSRTATAWLARTLPAYARAWRLDRASLRPEEEATRRLRLTARNDLLHIDNYPTRPSHGWRLLRLYVNLNGSDPRVWVTSETFAQLLQRYSRYVGLPTRQGLAQPWQWREQIRGLFRPGRPRRSLYDAFMLRFHDFLKLNDDFQERSPKRYWQFAPGSAWLLFGDSLSHAVLRGQHALEHSYFVSPQALRFPEESPLALLQRASGVSHLDRAA
jgi:hypothetical protein